MTARLALVGAPGSGKSTVAREVASRLGAPVRDTDQDYETAHGVPVSEALVEDEAAFRREEERLVLDALAEPGAVVAVGSGATSAGVVQGLAAVPVVWLQIGLAETARRTGLSGMRPLRLGNVRGQLHQMLQERAGFYSSLADVTVDVEGRSPAEIADEIQQWEARR